MTKEVSDLHFHAHQDLETIAKTLKVPLEKNSEHETSIQPDTPEVTGAAHGMVFEPGIHLLFLKFNTRKPLQFNFLHGNKPVTRFIFCKQGKALYQFDDGDLDYELTEMLGATMANSLEVKHQLKLSPEKAIQLLWIDIDKEAFQKQLPDKYQKYLKIENEEEDYLQVGHFNLAIAAAIQEIYQHTYRGLVGYIYTRAKCLEIVALRLHQLEQQKEKGDSLQLEEKDMETVLKARNIQLKSLRNPPNIQELARMVGTNENTLKKNFKVVYDKTINGHLTEKRLQQARLLLASGKMNIREVSIEVGYQNPGHFARLFKKRFGMLPREFLKSISKAKY